MQQNNSDNIGCEPPYRLWQVTVVDNCSYGRLGLMMALRQHIPQRLAELVLVKSPLDGLLSPCLPQEAREPIVEPWRCLVLRLAGDVTAALVLLLKLGGLPVAHYVRVVVVSPESLKVIVRRLLLSAGLYSVVNIVSARLSPPDLCQAILPVSDGNFVANREEESLLPCCPGRVLTWRERRALALTLQEVPIYEQARRAQVSMKTIYAQRTRALMKLEVQGVSALLRLCSPTNNG